MSNGGRHSSLITHHSSLITHHSSLPMFSGAYYHSVDDKGRTKMPGRFASRLGSEFVATRGMHGCLWIFEQAEWEKVLEKLGSESLVDSRALTLQRFFLGAATECDLDPQGRLTIP